MLARMLGRLLSVGRLILPLAAGCASSNARYNAETAGPADSWGGFWSILIAVLALVVGFLVGATITRNGASGFPLTGTVTIAAMKPAGTRSACASRMARSRDWPSGAARDARKTLTGVTSVAESRSVSLRRCADTTISTGRPAA